ncbi:unnamed protein product [Protopolystoma xenopodis]|uniref:Uncharacterized protein n=1 Tax=Protopolystoma xenopodis TaxID=117903 RepID=A0A3S5AT76_9PLAT|nr:unnamed protein product [Protopolystoma xenopodis]
MHWHLKPNPDSSNSLSRKGLTQEQTRHEPNSDLLLKDPGEIDSVEDDDDRFDIYLTDPLFSVSQTNRNYKEASDFVVYMKHRRAKMLSVNPTTT